jgi:hypothetical protein
MNGGKFMTIKTLSSLALTLLLTAAPALAKIDVNVDLPKEANQGQTITVAVKTSPEARCRIEASDAGLTQMLKLIDQKANSEGAASWKFDIPKDYKADTMPVVVTVEKNGEVEKSTNTIVINK